jgi:hypothetical protein
MVAPETSLASSCREALRGKIFSAQLRTNPSPHRRAWLKIGRKG